MALALLSGGCKGWLTIDSSDRIMENTLFETEEGFFTALNGVYAELPQASLYGKSLAAVTFDVQAQYFDTTQPSTHTFNTLGAYSAEAARRPSPIRGTKPISSSPTSTRFSNIARATAMCSPTAPTTSSAARCWACGRCCTSRCCASSGPSSRRLPPGFDSLSHEQRTDRHAAAARERGGRKDRRGLHRRALRTR